jgi:mRNA-degrading endonuclease RelE of RelBE toxin-antitoxin system
MRHFASPSFWEKYEELPDSIQELADKNYGILKEDPKHPSLHLKKAGKYWSVRVGRKYRALGIDMEEGILWFWIGTHAEYDKLLE